MPAATSNPSRSSRAKRGRVVLTVISALLCGLVMVEIIALTLVMRWTVPRLERTFEKLDTPLPALTQWVLDVRPMWVWIGASSAALVLLAKELALPSRWARLIVNLIALVVMLALGAAVVLSLFAPLLSASQSVASSPP